jgi:hypothetical protein
MTMREALPIYDRIREIFKEEGDISTDEVLKKLERKGYRPDRQAVHNIRYQMRQRGTMRAPETEKKVHETNGVESQQPASPAKEEPKAVEPQRTSEAKRQSELDEARRVLIDRIHLLAVAKVAKEMGGTERVREMLDLLDYVRQTE